MRGSPKKPRTGCCSVKGLTGQPYEAGGACPRPARLSGTSTLASVAARPVTGIRRAARTTAVLRRVCFALVTAPPSARPPTGLSPPTNRALTAPQACYKDPVQFRILGPLEVSGDDGPLPLGGQKQRAVLALLLLNAGRVVSTDTLIDALWGEAPPRTATTSLQNFVVGLRKVLGSETLVTRPPGYVLAVDADQVDVARFERL